MKLAVIIILLFAVCHASSLHFPGALFESFVAPAQPASHPKPHKTKIENKNVNVVVTLDPKVVASELMKLIEERTGQHQTRRTLETHQRIEEIEKVITPVLKRKHSKGKPSAFALAYALDHIAREALTRDPTNPPTMDDEIATRDVVADMMKTLKALTDDKSKTEDSVESKHTRRTLDDDEDDDLVTFKIQVQKLALRRAIKQYESI